MSRRLYTFAISHFAEKARWALDYKGVDYAERVLLPGSHLFVVRRIAPKTSVPVLRDGERVIQGSGEIIDYADEKWPARLLTPKGARERAEALELERWLDAEFGTTIRRFVYFHVLENREVVTRLFTQRGPAWGRAFYGAMFPVVRFGIRRMYAIEPDAAARDEKRLDAGLERLEALLDGKRFLVGDAFTRADLTLAALVAPLVGPPEHPTEWPPSDVYPEPVRALRARLARTAAHDHVLRMYREYRKGSAAAPF